MYPIKKKDNLIRKNRIFPLYSNKLTWSIAQGIRQGTSLRLPKINGKDDENAGAA
jgi:hypothetical protein